MHIADAINPIAMSHPPALKFSLGLEFGATLGDKSRHRNQPATRGSPQADVPRRLHRAIK
jgi:hypothetical protein